MDNDAAPRSKAKPKWAPTVVRPSLTGRQSTPLMVLNVKGKTVCADHLDEVDLDKVRPARQFVGQATQRNKPSRLMLQRSGQMVTVESDTEGVLAHLYESDQRVRRIIAQPFWIQRELAPATGRDSTKRRTTWVCPDFLIEYENGALLTLEVKRAGFTLVDAAQRKYDSVGESCRQARTHYLLREGLSNREREVFYLLHLHRRNNLLPIRDVEAIRTVVLHHAREG
ncbi:MAG: hypothetical protein H0U53_08565, partial [Actinobacteria bacterium]|nr:hypothetical protein [Actinomycetota bacterium]